MNSPKIITIMPNYFPLEEYYDEYLKSLKPLVTPHHTYVDFSMKSDSRIEVDMITDIQAIFGYPVKTCGEPTNIIHRWFKNRYIISWQCNTICG